MTLEKSLCFYYSDFYANNFIFTDAGEVCIIDFDQAGFLPPSFMSFALAESRWPPGHWVRDILRLPEHNLPAMKNVYYWFSIGVAWLGESGQPCPLCDLMLRTANVKLVVKGLPRPR